MPFFGLSFRRAAAKHKGAQTAQSLKDFISRIRPLADVAYPDEYDLSEVLRAYQPMEEELSQYYPKGDDTERVAYSDSKLTISVSILKPGEKSILRDQPDLNRISRVLAGELKETRYDFSDHEVEPRPLVPYATYLRSPLENAVKSLSNDSAIQEWYNTDPEEVAVILNVSVDRNGLCNGYNIYDGATGHVISKFPGYKPQALSENVGEQKKAYNSRGSG